jgi:hypothetical protein
MSDNATTSTAPRRRLSRPVAVLIAAAIGLGMLGGTVGAGLAEIGAASHPLRHAHFIDGTGLGSRH